MKTLYTDNDPFCCEWLRELVAAGHLPPADILCADIHTLTHEQLSQYNNVHLFAGIGGWPLALQLAGWPAEWPVWTGSCPCQPFSVAGKRAGERDERHLWPSMLRLITERRPLFVFGEQVPGAIGHGWLDGVSTDLEREGYAVGAVVLGAHSVGAPHIRQRLYWVALSQQPLRWPLRLNRQDERDGTDDGRTQAHSEPGACGEVQRLAHHHHQGLEVSPPHEQRPDAPATVEPCGAAGGVGFANGSGCKTREPLAIGAEARPERAAEPGTPSRVEHAAESRRTRQDRSSKQKQGFGAGCITGWLDSHPHICLDGKTRRIPLEPSFFPLAHGLQPARVGILRGAGNAIVPLCAARFTQAALEALEEISSANVNP